MRRPWLHFLHYALLKEEIRNAYDDKEGHQTPWYPGNQWKVFCKKKYRGDHLILEIIHHGFHNTIIDKVSTFNDDSWFGIDFVSLEKYKV